jgi:serine phosphatase RsbU (regulator of sigma subunit)/anti-sigma regulatory factor (Ser/Thr protein kinase)
MDSNYGFQPYPQHDAAAAFEPQVRKALFGRPAEFASATGCAVAWEYGGLLSWVVASPDACFTIEHGQLRMRAGFRQEDHSPRGPDGRSGLDGQSGQTGRDGQNGRDGHNGRDGQNGRDGHNGRDGQTGRDGHERNEDGGVAGVEAIVDVLVNAEDQLALLPPSVADPSVADPSVAGLSLVNPSLASGAEAVTEEAAVAQATVAQAAAEQKAEREYRCVPATVQNQLIGYIHICCPSRLARSGLVGMLGYMLEMVEKERQEDSLLQELSASWESLDALFEWTVDMRNLPNRQEMLNRIIERAVAVRPGARAILWIEEGDLLLPTAWVAEARPQPRSKSVGVVGRALDQRNSLVLRRAGRLSQILDTEPELRTATSVVVVPISTQSQLHGALEVWSDDDEIEFESPQLRLLEALSMQAALVVENDRLYSSQIESERLRQEVDIGSRIQQSLLFSKVPERIEGAEIASLTLPSQTIDGDFYDIVDHNPHCFDVVVGDVMGKGVPAAILAAGAKSGLFRSLCQLMVDAGRRDIPQPDAIVSKLNSALARQMMSVDSFASMSYARFNLKTKTVTFVDAGHTKTFHLRVRDHQTFLLQGENLPLGILEDEVYQQIAHGFEPGDVFVFYSDGITEARNAEGEFYGEFRLYDCVRKSTDRTADGLVRAIRQSVVSFSGREVFLDDLTCVVVRIQPNSAQAIVTRESRVFTSDLRELSRIRQWVNDLWLRWAPREHEEAALYQLVLAVNEVSSNVMRHAYKGDGQQRIRMRAWVQRNRFVLELAHTGEPFDPQSKEAPVFDGSREGGFGVFIIENSVDEIVYSRNDGDWHTIRIEKSYFAPAQEKD